MRSPTSDKALGNLSLQSSLCYGVIYGHTYNAYYCLPPSESEEDFSELYHESPVGLLYLFKVLEDIRTIKMVARFVPYSCSSLHSASSNPSKLTSKCFYQFIAVAGFAPDKLSSADIALWLHLFLELGMTVCPVTSVL